ncbi:MAG: cysteine--tRNA ligase [bacterium]|nr:cysteine--tRNA ligase [bacterium]
MITIFNTLSKKKEEFKPIKNKTVSFYHCGPTVYWTQHIGNLRAMIEADLIVRSLEYQNYKVKLVRNYTDVGHLTSDEDEGEDKITKGAKRDKKTPQEIADKYIAQFDKDLELLNTRQANYKPRATEMIKEMIKMTKKLLTKGFAYSTDLAIYFDVTKAKDYNRLSKQQLNQNIDEAGKGRISDSNKKHSADFALWFFKAGTHENALQTWPSPFKSNLVNDGEGFPGWHIECSAMSQKLLGDTIDIHMGGIEHIPVHHTNEIAQSESYTGKKFVNYWLHNEHLMINNGKMAKSDGTSYILQDIINKGFNPLAFRYFVMGAHYRSKINFTWPAMESAQKAYDNFTTLVGNLGTPKIGCAEYEQKFLEAISDDFNIPKALALTWDLLKSDYPDSAKKASILKFDKVFGLNLKWFKPTKIPDEIKEITKQREQFRVDKNWTKSDIIRDELLKRGWQIEDTDAGPIIKKVK